ncbi:MAG: hypothetical protein HY650_11700 [Acidobacteria bacterium]|nr:hypothetical protein [Acidobacteriota bacterium]
MKTLKLICALAAVAAALTAAVVPATYADQAAAKATKKACSYCHSSKSMKEYSKSDLTAAGKHFKEHKNLEGFKEEGKPAKKG